MEHTFWHDKWLNNEIGFHQAQGHSALRRFWPHLPIGARVLVPLCGKSQDLLWLAERGCSVTGVELSQKAIKAFFQENALEFDVESTTEGDIYKANEKEIVLFCGDFFAFQDDPFDALYDRAALVALPESLRPVYVKHCQALLKEYAVGLLVTYDYIQSDKTGPPFSVSEPELRKYWGDCAELQESVELIGIDTVFRQRGLDSIVEQVWLLENRPW